MELTEIHGEFFKGLFGGSKTPFNFASSVSPCGKLLKKQSVKSVRQLAMCVNLSFF